MNFPCCTSPPLCFDPASPILNLSSEEPDAEVFIARFFGTNPPPLGSLWYSNECNTVYISTISQDDADAGAQRNAVGCIADQQPQLVEYPGVPEPFPSGPPPETPGDTPDLPTPQQPGESLPPTPGEPPLTIPGPTGPIPVIPTGRTTFQNTVQSCDFVCPDGNVFTYTVAAGTFSAFNQATADSLAHSSACNRAVDTRICIGELSVDTACVGVDYNQSVSVSAMQVPIVVSLVSGTLPMGMGLDYDDVSFQISGTSNTVGTFIFTVQVEDPDGNFMQKEFTVKVVGFLPDSLPDGELNEAYSETFSTDGPVTGTVSWAVTSGSLPPGLSLNSSTGEISGTPTDTGSYTFTVTMTF